MSRLSGARHRLALALLAAICFGAVPSGAEVDVTAVAIRSDVQRGFELLDGLEQQSLDWLVQLTETPAPPFGEQARAELVMALLKAVGVTGVELDQIGNVIGRISGMRAGKTLALVAHLDTVFPIDTDLVVKRQGDTYCAPGISDNGRGLVALLAIARVILAAEVSFPGELLLVASVGEEGIGDLRGVRYLLREGGPQIDEFVAIDGAGTERLTTVAVGSIRYRIRVAGPGGHSWGAFGLANPAHGLARAINHFDEAAYTFVGTPGPKTTYNIGRIGGGTSVNSIPFENWAEVDLRSSDPARLEHIDSLLKLSVRDAINRQNDQRTRGEPLTVVLEPIGNRPAGSTPVTADLVQRVVAAMKYQGIVPDFRDGSTDANVPISMGIPALTLGGGGSSTGSHSLQECWTNDHSTQALKTLLLTIATLPSDGDGGIKK